jgi:hypothetical protein
MILFQVNTPAILFLALPSPRAGGLVEDHLALISGGCNGVFYMCGIRLWFFINRVQIILDTIDNTALKKDFIGIETNVRKRQDS